MVSMHIHSSWQDTFQKAYASLTPEFQAYLEKGQYLPKNQQVFAVFSRPKSAIKQVLLGESPYPRANSANGYAFWDADVHELWSSSGLSKAVNRATSLRNFLKMLLHANGDLQKPFLAKDIATLPKKHLIQTLDELFEKMIKEGFLLLNASLTWSKDMPVTWHALHWQPFIELILQDLLEKKPETKILLFGKIAQKFKFLPQENCIIAEHPYVLTFIENQSVLEYFKPFHLLSASNE